MKKYVILLLFFIIKFLFSQSGMVLNRPDLKLNSVFADLKSGRLSGTINGVIFLRKSDSTEIILDFQGGHAILNVIPDSSEVYDISTKKYSGVTASGRTKFSYVVYATSNEIQIEFTHKKYGLSFIDGCRCFLIDGLSFYFKHEPEFEYLVLIFEKEIKLGRDFKLNSEDNIVILPHSTLVFAIKRK